MKVYLNGAFVDAGQAQLSIFDAATQHGVGLFETMQAYHGHVFQLTEHLQRLAASAKTLGLTDQIAVEPLAEAVRLTLSENNLTEARIRLTVTGGDLSLLQQPATTPHHPSIFITVTEPTRYPTTFFTQGVSTIIADAKANPFDPMAGHKTINYWQRLRTLTQASAMKAGEAIWFSISNHLCGGSVSNIFLIKDQKILTPIAHDEETDGALTSPVRPGITRQVLLDVAPDLGLKTDCRMLTIEDLLAADEVLLTNSSWQVLPVVQVEKETIGQGKPGPITEQLRQALFQKIDQMALPPGIPAPGK